MLFPLVLLVKVGLGQGGVLGIEEGNVMGSRPRWTSG
jgi:hypothetical protein